MKIGLFLSCALTLAIPTAEAGKCIGRLTPEEYNACQDLRAGYPTECSAPGMTPEQIHDCKVRSLRSQARDEDPQKAAAICADAKAKEKALLLNDHLAEYMESTELFRLRNLQDLCCEAYKARNLPKGVSNP